MKTIISLLVALLTCFGLYAQKDQMISQYMFNGLFLNPAYAGSHKYFSSSLLFRSQWVNFEGAPQTYIAAVDGPIATKNMGVGLQIGYDVAGITTQTDVYGSYAYQLKLKTGKLAFGVKAGASQYYADRSKLRIWDPGDPVYTGGSATEWIPKFGMGAYYFQERMYAGISIPTLFAYDDKSTFSLDLNRATQLKRHYYLNAGYVFPVNEHIMLRPSFLLKYLPNSPLQGDINLNALFDKVLWLGVSYRTGDAVVAILEYQVNDYVRVGYAYDFTTTQIRNYSNGSHEIMLGIDFGKDLIKIKTPRYF